MLERADADSDAAQGLETKGPFKSRAWAMRWGLGRKDSVSLHCNAMAPVRPVLGCALADQVVQAHIWHTSGSHVVTRGSLILQTATLAIMSRST